MPDLVAHRQPRDFLGAERFLVEIDRLGAIINRQDDVHAAIAFWNGLGHLLSPKEIPSPGVRPSYCRLVSRSKVAGRGLAPARLAR